MVVIKVHHLTGRYPIYLSELYWLAQDIVNRTEHLFSEAPTPVDGKLSATESESDR